MEASPAPTPALSLARAADALGLFRPTVAALLAAGKLPGAVKVGHRWSIPAADVERLKASLPSTEGRFPVEEAARRLGLSPITLRRYAWEGKLKGVHIGRRWWFDAAALEAFKEGRAERMEAGRLKGRATRSPPAGFLSAAEAAALRGISVVHMHRLMRLGIVSAEKAANGRWLLPADQAGERLKARKRGRPRKEPAGAAKMPSP